MTHGRPDTWRTAIAQSAPRREITAPHHGGRPRSLAVGQGTRGPVLGPRVPWLVWAARYGKSTPSTKSWMLPGARPTEVTVSAPARVLTSRRSLATSE